MRDTGAYTTVVGAVEWHDIDEELLRGLDGHIMTLERMRYYPTNMRFDDR